MWKALKDISRVCLPRNGAITSECKLEEPQNKLLYTQNSQTFWKKKDFNHLLISENVNQDAKNNLTKKIFWKTNSNFESQKLLGGISWCALFAIGCQFGLPLIKSHIHEIHKKLSDGCVPKCSKTPQILPWLAFSMPSSKFGSIKNPILPEKDCQTTKPVDQVPENEHHKDIFGSRFENNFRTYSIHKASSSPSLHQNDTDSSEIAHRSHSLPNLSSGSKKTTVNLVTELLEQHQEDQKSDLRNKIGLSSASKNDFKEAFKCFKLASFNSNIDALHNLGICHERGLGTEQDIEKAMQCYKRAADLGHQGASFNLGVLECSLSSQESVENGIKKLIEAAQCGNKAAQSYVGCHYLKISEYHGAVWMLKAATTQGDIDAMCNLALCYENGWGVAVDQTEAIRLYTKASDSGSLHATYCLAMIHHHGKGIPKNENFARKLYQEILEREKEIDVEIVEEVKCALNQLDASRVKVASTNPAKKRENSLHGSQSLPEMLQNDHNGPLIELFKTLLVSMQPKSTDGILPKFWIGDEEENEQKGDNNNLSVIFS